MNKYNSLKQKVLQLVGDCKSDSKSKSAKAEEEFFKLCKGYTLCKKALEIENLKKDYIKKYKSLKSKYKEIEIMEYSKE